MQLSLICLAVKSACRDIGMQWRNEQRLKAFHAGQEAVKVLA